MTENNREMTDDERNLVRWMLEHSGSDAAAFLPQLEIAEVTPWQCTCGCASINFQIRGRPEAPAGVHPIADFVFGDDATLSGIFVYEIDGILSGLEVYGLAGDAPKALPRPDELRPFDDHRINRVRATVADGLPTPPDMRASIRRFISSPSLSGRSRITALVSGPAYPASVAHRPTR